jgi:hypothetical protein
VAGENRHCRAFHRHRIADVDGQGAAFCLDIDDRAGNAKMVDDD